MNDREKRRNAEIEAAQEVHSRLIGKHFPQGHAAHDLDPIHAGVVMANFFFGGCPEPDKTEYAKAHYVRIF